MYIGMFFIGFLAGAVFVYLLFKFMKKQANSFTDAAMEQMKLYFENTANKVLEDNSSSFSSKTDEKLEEYFKRFRDKIDSLEKKNEENLKFEIENFTRFDENIKCFLETGNRISQDASNLVNVMRSDNRTQGHWGEIVLERVLEASGLRKEEEYKIQYSTSEGRPDATVLLTENRLVFIDAKTSIASWLSYVNAENAADKEQYLKEFIASTKSHILGLAKREYSNNEFSPEFVLMFIPIESCYSLMFCDNCELWDLAWKNRIMPVSPSTLLAALKTINSFHLVEKQNKNAQEISRLASAMIDKFSDLLADLIKSRESLNSCFVKLQGRGNILTQIEKIEALGIKHSKEVPKLPKELLNESKG